MNELEYDAIATQLSLEPHIPSVISNRRNATVLVQTRAVLQAARLTAEAEMRTLGLSEDHGNPLDPILTPDAHPFFARLSNAISNAAASHAFGTPAERDTDSWVSGLRVRLRHRPDHNVFLPDEIPVGARGELYNYAPTEELGEGWQVRWDDYGTWWTTNDSLELT